MLHYTRLELQESESCCCFLGEEMFFQTFVSQSLHAFQVIGITGTEGVGTRRL
jgi:hypothetical protein